MNEWMNDSEDELLRIWLEMLLSERPPPAFLYCLTKYTKKCAEYLSLSLAGLVRLFQVQISREWFVACQQPNDASQAYVVYLVGRRPSGSMNSLTAALPRDVSIPITPAARKGCWQHRCIFSLFPDSQYFRWHTQWLLRVTSSIEVIQSYACYCLLVSIQNQVKQGNSRIELTVASK